MRLLIIMIGTMLASSALAQTPPGTEVPAWVASAPAAIVPETSAAAPAASPAPADAPPAAAGEAPAVEPPASGNPVTEKSVTEAPAEAPAVPPAGRDAYKKILREKAVAMGVPYELADAVAEVESGYNRAALGGVGEIGLMQVLPSTARMLGFSGTLAELAHPETNIHYGVTYLAQAWRLANQDICTAVMKYRAGHGESRFSHRSVDYCIKVRRGLTARGYTVTGEVPKATFGEPVGGGPRVAGRQVGKKSRLDWRAADARWRAITGKVNSGSLMIMQ